MICALSFFICLLVCLSLFLRWGEGGAQYNIQCTCFKNIHFVSKCSCCSNIDFNSHVWVEYVVTAVFEYVVLTTITTIMFSRLLVLLCCAAWKRKQRERDFCPLFSWTLRPCLGGWRHESRHNISALLFSKADQVTTVQLNVSIDKDLAYGMA